MTDTIIHVTKSETKYGKGRAEQRIEAIVVIVIQSTFHSGTTIGIDIECA